MADLRDLVINTITNSPLTLTEAVELYARMDVPAVTPWHDKIDEIGVKAARKLFADAGLKVGGMLLCGLFANEGRDKREDHMAENRRRLDMAAELGAPFMVTVPGGLFPESRDLDDAIKYNFDAMTELLAYARKVGVTLGLEPLHPMYCADWSVVTRIETANDWCDQLGDGIGIIIDAYHTWWDPDLRRGIERAGKAGRLVGYHVNDWRVPTRDILMDRALMGDGVIDLPGLTRMMRDAGFKGPIEVEIFSNEWWDRDPETFVAAIKERFVSHV